MGLLPEFFMILGLDIFLALSLIVTFLFDNHTPHVLRYLYQAAAGLGLGEIILDKILIDVGVFGLSPSDPNRFWVSLTYLASAISSVIGFNVYLVVVRRQGALASAFSGAVTVPTLIVSSFFISSFTGSNGEVSFTPDGVYLLAVAMFVSGLSLFSFLHQASKHIGVHHQRLDRQSKILPPTRMDRRQVSHTPNTPGPLLALSLPSRQKDEWEEAPKKEERGE